MTEQEVMAELEAMGTAQNRKIYRRHGAQEPLFGVSYANLGVLRKRIKRDQPLAEALWATGNHDARVLATMIADPKAISHLTVDTWTRDLNSYPVADAVAGLVAKTPFARACVEPWVNSRRRVGRTVWVAPYRAAGHERTWTFPMRISPPTWRASRTPFMGRRTACARP